MVSLTKLYTHQQNGTYPVSSDSRGELCNAALQSAFLDVPYSACTINDMRTGSGSTCLRLLCFSEAIDFQRIKHFQWIAQVSRRCFRTVFYSFLYFM